MFGKRRGGSDDGKASFEVKHRVALSEKDEAKLAINLNKADPKVVDLSKKAAVSLTKAGIDNITLEACAVLDYSYSMEPDYQSGAVQELAEKVLAFALQTDPDGRVDVFIFGSGSDDVGPVTVENYPGFVQREIVAKRRMGSTNLGAALKDVIDWASKLRSPGIAYIITDGQPDDPAVAQKLVCRSAQYPIMLKFISLAPVDFLNTLDDLPDTERLLDNCDACDIDPRTASAETFYSAMTEEVGSWIQLALAAGVITND